MYKTVKLSGKERNENEKEKLENKNDLRSAFRSHGIVYSSDPDARLCMYRQYFLELEKAWNTPEKVMARAWQIANRQERLLY